MSEPYALYKAERAEAADPNLKALGLPTAFRTLAASRAHGNVPVAVLNFATNPINANADTISIGADTYEFRDPAADVTNDAYIAVAIGGTAPLTLANLVLAINARVTDNEHPSIFLAGGVLPALANGTERIVADAIGAGTALRIKAADAPGGSVLAGNPNVLLAEALTAAADVWDVGNVNLNTLGGVADETPAMAIASRVITAAMIAGTATCRFAFPFTVTRFMAFAANPSGAGVTLGATDTAYIQDGDVLIGFGGGAAPNVQALDVLTILAFA
jgi:hypothetical protein